MSDKDSLILKLITEIYQEDERRNELIDTKNSQMILLLSTIFTLYISLSTNTLIQYVLNNPLIFFKIKIMLVTLFIISLILIIYSLYYFIKAYSFREDFEGVPSTEILIYYAEEDTSVKEINEELIHNFAEVIKSNDKILSDKRNLGRKGLKGLEISIILILIFIIFLLYFLI